MPRKRNGNGRPKKRYFPVVSAGVGLNILDEHGWMGVIQQMEAGADLSWADSLQAISDNSNMGAMTSSVVKGLVLAGAKRHLGHVPLISGRKSVLCLF